MSSLCGCPPLSTVIRRPSLFVSVGPSGRHHFCLFDPSVVTLTTVVRTPLLWLSLFSHRFGCFFVSNRRLIHHFGHLRQSGRSSLSIISGPSGYRRFIASSNVSVSGETSLSLAPSPSLCLLSVVVLSPVQLFLVICPVLSGRPLAVRPTLHPEASIGHSANYWSLFGAPFRPLVRSLVFSRLHLREFQPPPSLAISAGCRSGHSRSVVGCLAAPVVVRLFRSLLYGCCTADATIWQPLHTARPIGWPFLPLRLYFGHFCHSSEAVRPLQPSSFLTVRLRLRRPSSFGPFRAVVRFIGCLYFFISVRCYPSLLGHSSGCLCAFGSNCLPLARSFVCCAV